MTKWKYCPECTTALEPTQEGYSTCPKGHFTQYYNPVGATAAFIRNNDEYLLIKRAKEPQKGWWDLPGGFVEYDESAEDALLREIKEETNLQNVKIVDFLGSFPGNYGGFQKVLDLIFIIESADRELQLSEENTEYNWVKLDEIPELAFDDLNNALKTLKGRGDIISA